MKRKIKCYMAYTTFIYRILGEVLIPCAFWLLCVVIMWSEYGGLMGVGQPDSVGGYSLYFCLSAYVVAYEVFTDYWVLGGCLSEAGRGLRYFRTSHNGVEVMRNIVLVDLTRRFLYCMIFSVIILLFTGWKTSIAMGLAMYCVIVGVLNGSRHFDGLQRNTGIAFLAQVGAAVANVINVILIELVAAREGIMLICLVVFYGMAALCISKVMVRRITTRIKVQKVKRLSATSKECRIV